MGSCGKKVASVFPVLSNDGHLSQTSPRPVLSYLDPENRQPGVVPCLRLAVRTGTTSLRKETYSCCPFWSPPTQRLAASISFQHFVGTTSSILKCKPAANASLSKPALHSNLSQGSVQILTVSRPSRSHTVTDFPESSRPFDRSCN